MYEQFGAYGAWLNPAWAVLPSSNTARTRRAGLPDHLGRHRSGTPRGPRQLRRGLGVHILVSSRRRTFGYRRAHRDADKQR